MHDITSVTRKAWIGERTTLPEAERLARHHAARRGIVVSIMQGRREIARCTRDALGRLWTDVLVMEPVL